MRVLFTTESLHPEQGGTTHCISGLCAALGREGVQPEILALNYGRTWKPPLTPPLNLVRTTFVDCNSAFLRRLRWTPRFDSLLRERCRDSGAQILHDNGVWLLTNHAAAGAARKFSLPLIISPHGMLKVWSLQHKGWKKRLALALYQRRDLDTAQVLHATADAEAADFRAMGLRQPIAVIPNGIELPMNPNAECRMQNAEFRTVLFLGRIHPIKGLLNLVGAWGVVRPAGWRVVIAGGDEGGHLNELKAEIGRLKLENSFEFVGPTEGAAKWDLYRAADVFVLPSHTENFGIVVAEALACGVPVITTRGTPWEDLLTHRCGWWVDKGVEPLAAALREAMAMDDKTRRLMGARGRELAVRKFGWPGIAAMMHGVYRWMLKADAKPDCVRLD